MIGWRKLHCPKGPWARAKRRFYRHRQAELFRVRVTPFHYAGHDWAAPWPIALCESGGDYHVGFAGAYGLIAPGWSTGGGLEFAPSAGEATPRQQDIVAHRLYVRYGTAPWTPFEGGCTYR